MKIISLYLFLQLIMTTAYAENEYAFEISKYKAGVTCKKLSGTWFTDVQVDNMISGEKRDITRIDRNADGTAYLKGVSIYLDTGKVSFWEFPSKWSCDSDWYVEKNEWGYTAFKIDKIFDNKIVYLDIRNNLSATKPIKITEIKYPRNLDSIKNKRKVMNLLEI